MNRELTNQEDEALYWRAYNYTYRQIGIALQVSRQRAQQIVAKARAKEERAKLKPRRIVERFSVEELGLIEREGE